MAEAAPVVSATDRPVSQRVGDGNAHLRHGELRKCPPPSVLQCMQDRLSWLPLGLALSLLGCGAEDSGEPEEALILAEYLEEYPGLPAQHGDWHRNNLPGSAEFGARFLTMHGHMAMAYDEWREERGHEPVPAWDPALPIPESAFHPGRTTSDPASTCPTCVTPSWFTLEGGDAVDPHSGAQRLADFESADQLGRSINAPGSPEWHTSVHDAIGGDMGDNSTAARDPVFWLFHRTIDDVFRNWLELKGEAYPADTHHL